MHDLSLYLLELLENSVRAQATRIRVELFLDQASDTLRLRVDDNGQGLAAPAEQALDPFFTTKKGKKTGLGLSLLKADAEAAGGYLRIGTSPVLGGVRVETGMQLSHVDRPPLGDIGTTLVVTALTNPQVEFSVTLEGDWFPRPLTAAPLAQAAVHLGDISHKETVWNQAKEAASK